MQRATSIPVAPGLPVLVVWDVGYRAACRTACQLLPVVIFFLGKEVARERVEFYADSIGATYIETSAKDDIRISDVFLEIGG